MIKPGMSIGVSILALIGVLILCGLLAFCIWKVTVGEEWKWISLPIELQRDARTRSVD